MVPGGIGWKETATSAITTLRADEFDKISWQKCARDYQLTFLTKKQVVHKFSGFPKEVKFLFGIFDPIFVASCRPLNLSSLLSHKITILLLIGVNIRSKDGIGANLK
jgi:POB3-like N-terminal PH domain